MWILLSILAVLLLLLFLPVTVEAAYQEELTLKIRYLFFRFLVLPAKTKEEAEDKSPKEKKEKVKEETDKKKKKITLDSVLEILELAKQALSSLRDPLGWFLRKIRYRNLWFHIMVCQEDAHQTALRYGQVQAIFHSVFSLLRSCMDIQTTDIQIDADFIGEEEHFSGGIKVKIRPLYAFIFAFWFAGSFGIGYLKRKHTESKMEQELKEKSKALSNETK